jgi:hypothetical protein
MLDSNEQAKGGFGAFAARERERQDGLALAAVNAEMGAPVPDGCAPVTKRDAPPTAAPTAAPTGRQPKRWR